MSRILNPSLYRIRPDVASINAESNQVTRATVEALLDAGSLQAAMRNGNWWTIRRNGRTQTWKRDANRIRIPIKCGLRTTGAITESDFI